MFSDYLCVYHIPKHDKLDFVYFVTLIKTYQNKGRGLQLAEHLPSMSEPQVQSLGWHPLSIMVHACNYSTQEREVKGSEVQSHLQLLRQLKAVLSYIRPCLEKFKASLGYIKSYLEEEKENNEPGSTLLRSFPKIAWQPIF